MYARLSASWTALPGATRGILLMLVSTLAFSTMHVLIRFLSKEIDPLQVAFFRNFFGVIVILPWFIRYGLQPLRTKHLGTHLLRSVLNVGAMLCFFAALGLIPVAEATALTFSAPIFAALLAVVLLREVMRLRRWTAILVGFLGTLLILQPGFETIDLGSWLTLLAAFLWGLTLIVIRVLGKGGESSVTTTTYMVIFLSLFSLGPAILVWQTPTLEQLGWMLVIGVLGTLGQLAVAQSLKDAETGVVMPFDFFKLIWAAILGYLLFAEVPGPFVWIGGAVIFGASTYIAYRESQVASAEAKAALERAKLDRPV